MEMCVCSSKKKSFTPNENKNQKLTFEIFHLFSQSKKDEKKKVGGKSPNLKIFIDLIYLKASSYLNQLWKITNIFLKVRLSE